LDRASREGRILSPYTSRMTEEPDPRRLRAWLTWATVATLGLVLVLYAAARWWR